MNGKRIYALLSDVDDDLITDADVSDRLPAVGKKEKRGPSAFRRWMDSPAAAAVISAVVAFTVLFLIVRAGQNAPVNPGPTPAGRGTLPVTETGAAESEPPHETTPEAPTESPTEPQTAVPGQDVQMGIIGGADAPTARFILREILTYMLPALLIIGAAAAGIVLLLRSGRKKQPDAVPAPQDPPTRAQKVLITVLAVLFLLFTPYLLRLQIDTIRMSGYFISSGYVTGGLFAALKLLKPIGAMLPSLAACAAGLVFAVSGAVLTWMGRLDRRRASTFSGIAGGLACFAAMWFPRLCLILISANGKWWEDDLLTLPAYTYWQSWRAFGFIGPRDGVNVSLLTDGTAYAYVHPVMLGLIIAAAAAVVLLSLIAGWKNVPAAGDCRRTSRVLTLLTSVVAGVSGAVSLYGIFIILFGLFGRMIGSLLFSVAGYDLTILDTDTVSCVGALLLILALAAASLVTAVIVAIRLKRAGPAKRADVVLTAVTAALQLFLRLFIESVLRDNFEGRAMLRELFAGAGVLTSGVQCLMPFAIAAACALAVMLVRRRKAAEGTGEPEKH